MQKSSIRTWVCRKHILIKYYDYVSLDSGKLIGVAYFPFLSASEFYIRLERKIQISSLNNVIIIYTADNFRICVTRINLKGKIGKTMSCWCET
jgi:hypothetical protein